MTQYRRWSLAIVAMAAILATRSAVAGAVSLPFLETFDTPTLDAVTTYPQFTADDGGSGLTPTRIVNASGVPLFKNNVHVGGVGVAGVSRAGSKGFRPAHAEAVGVGAAAGKGGLGAGAGAEAVRAGPGVRPGVRPPGRAPDE